MISSSVIAVIYLHSHAGRLKGGDRRFTPAHLDQLLFALRRKRDRPKPRSHFFCTMLQGQLEETHHPWS